MINKNESKLFIKTEPDGAFKKIYPDDLASLDVVDEEKVLVTLGNRYSRGQYQTYAGTALLIINPQMEQSKVYEKEVKKKFFLPSFLPFFLNFYFKFPLINLCIFLNIISTTSAICLRLAQTRNPTFSRW